MTTATSKRYDTYYEFRNGIYPCSLCIAVGRDWHNDDFNEEINKTPDNSWDAVTFDTQTKPTGHCVLIRFMNKSYMKHPKVAPHEAMHAVINMFEWVGMEVNNETSEAASYLMGWIMSCIERVRTGKLDTKQTEIIHDENTGNR